MTGETTLGQSSILLMLAESPAATDAYFDHQFSREWGKLTGRAEEECSSIIRRQAQRFESEGRHKGERGKYALCVQDACQTIIKGFIDGSQRDCIAAKRDAAAVLAGWNLAWAYGIFVARSRRID